MEKDRKLHHNDYTVGWVCALSKEQTAAVAMLDHRHNDLPKKAKDPNAYNLGSIAEHNIVIACLPEGQVGTNSADNVTTWMIATFPSIKVGFMVGIGGGVPPTVRLGDVVVSTPTDRYPGVVQWDLGKAEKDGEFKQIGSLNKPPTSLCTALAKLKTENELNGSKIPEYLDELKVRWPNLVEKYTWTKALKDPLLETDTLCGSHGRSSYVFSTFLGTLLSLVKLLFSWLMVASVDREATQRATKSAVNAKDEVFQDVQVHYGLIASGNQVIKDAKFRDRLNQRYGGNVLCVEMEAAGLMDNFPCIVIRGICDYADSQKNKQWQEYAAAIAAAFAKELLQHISPSDVGGERRMVEVLGQV